MREWVTILLHAWNGAQDGKEKDEYGICEMKRNQTRAHKSMHIEICARGKTQR